MKSSETRESFLRFFEERGHQRVPSAPVVLYDDPTLYFTNAGMNQFKDVFLGMGKRDYTRAVDSQKCIRVSGKHNDLEEVGLSPGHHTFFEMLGNWSFGDYFKREAIEWAWALVTEHWGLEKERLWSTVFEGDENDSLDRDEEAEKLWLDTTDQVEERIVRLPAKDVFWEMGATGPCGPSSELHYYLGDDLSKQTAGGLRDGDNGFLEIWNLVFIQFNRDDQGQLHELPAKHVDTGMGFERICRILQKAESNYDTDIFQPLISRIADLTGSAYEGEYLVPMRVIADHMRALTFAIADGALPANDGAGYVLRRILRRAARYARQLNQHEPFIFKLTSTVTDLLGSAYPEIAAKSAHISMVIESEEESFGRTLDRGLDIFERLSQKNEISGADAFQLYDTFGFPLDLTELMARERGLKVDVDGFQVELESQRQRARKAGRTQFSATEGVADVLEADHFDFVGYDELETESEVVFAGSDAEGNLQIFLDRTPFYAESGGQVGDQGAIEGSDFAVEVLDTVKGRGGIMHVGRLLSGDMASIRGSVRTRVDAGRRLDGARHHTSTHLLHEALRRILGTHVAQMGSLVAPERLRFDFSHFNPIDAAQLEEIESMVNEEIRADREISTFEEELEKAKSMGAQALFGEKYADRVRVVRIGDFSLELCGGTHVKSTGEIGRFDLISEGGIAAGTRRAEALAGTAAESAAHQQRETLARLAALLNSPDYGQLPGKINDLLQRQRDTERQLSELQQQIAGQQGVQLADNAVEVEGIKVVTGRVDNTDVSNLRSLADGLRLEMGSGLGVIGTALEGKVALVAVVTEDLIAERGLRAGDIVKVVAERVGGSGGGKPHLAQAGGKYVEKLEEALASVPEIVRQHVRK